MLSIDREYADRLDQEKIVAQRSKELALLTQEEAAQKLEAQKRHQDFLVAKNAQDIKELQAKKAAIKLKVA